MNNQLLALIVGIVIVVLVGLIVTRLRSQRTSQPTTPKIPKMVVSPNVSGVNDRQESVPGDEPARQLTVRPWTSRDSNANGEFVVLEPGDLREVAIVAQALDNQWVQRSFLPKMVQEGWSIASPEVVQHQLQYARAEYIRSLINAEQVIINRPFLYNSAVVRRDYIGGDPHTAQHRAAFKDLLGDGVIVPYLYDEQSPVDRPIFHLHEEAYGEWVKLAQEVRTHCLRLSWDATDNKEQIGVLSGLFDEWAVKASRGDTDAYALALGIPDDRKAAFNEKLRALGKATIDSDKKLTRNELYKQFVILDTVGDGGDPMRDPIDPQKEFAVPLRQLADLRYNINLPDMLGRYALTPIDALPRTALQELKILSSEQQRPVDERSIVDLLRRTNFALIQEGLYLQGMEQMELEDVQVARSTDEWMEYILSMRALLVDPLGFQEKAGDVYASYTKLMKRMTDLIKARRGKVLEERWLPIISFVINIGSAIITTHWGSPVPGFAGNLGYTLSTNAAQSGATRIVGRLIIQGAAGIGTQARLESSIDFMKGKVRDGKELWNELVNKTLPEAGFHQITEPTAVRELEDSAVINYAEQPAVEMGAA